MQSSPTSTAGTTPAASKRNWATSAPTSTKPPGTPARRNQPSQLSLPLHQPAAGNHHSIKAEGTHPRPASAPSLSTTAWTRGQLTANGFCRPPADGAFGVHAVLDHFRLRHPQEPDLGRDVVVIA